MSQIYHPKVDRRTTLKWLGAVTSVTAVLGGCNSSRPKPTTHVPGTFTKYDTGYGADADIMNPVVPWKKIMTTEQLQITAVMCDIILPDDGQSPAASVVGIPDFMDEWVSAPYPDQQKDTKIILGGLKWLDQYAQKRFKNKFVKLQSKDQYLICDHIAKPSAAKAQALFFERLRHLTVEAYYSTGVGVEAIGYVGNVPLSKFEGPSPKILEILEGEMKKMGL